MAFQAGTRVRPELANADFSGFARAAEIQANTLAQLGATIGGAIAASKQKKQDKALSEQAANLVFSFANANPEAGKQLGIETLDDAKVVVKTLGGAKPTLALLMELQPSQQTMKPSSPGAMASAEVYAKGLGFDFNPETGKMETVEGPGFLRSLGNILTPGQPFGSPQTVEMPQEIIEGTTGMQQFIQQQQALTETSDVPVVDDNDPMGILR
jgi:hypothetical protein